MAFRRGWTTRFSVAPLLFCWAFGVAGRAAATQAAPPNAIAPADSSHVLLEGLFDRSDPSAPVVIWPGSRIRFETEGPLLILHFNNRPGQTFFDLHVDEASCVVGFRRPGPQSAAWPLPLGPGRHRVLIFKRSEPAAGCASLTAIETAAGTRVRPSRPPHYRLAMLFFGDSIAAGACNEDRGADQWADRSTHDNALSYGALVADQFRADYRNRAVSGMGVCEGCAAVTAGQIWDRLYPAATSPRADLKSWAPDIVFIHLGENDASHSREAGRPFPADFADRYVALVRNFRRAYPDARIVLLRGGMEGGARDPALRRAWESAVARLEARDRKISHYAFAHWTARHPRIGDDRALAGELGPWLWQQAFMARWMAEDRGR